MNHGPPSTAIRVLLLFPATRPGAEGGPFDSTRIEPLRLPLAMAAQRASLKSAERFC